eukprot:2260746-Amphidinium_carterae.1
MGQHVFLVYTNASCLLMFGYLAKLGLHHCCQATRDSARCFTSHSLHVMVIISARWHRPLHRLTSMIVTCNNDVMRKVAKKE